MGGMGVHAVTDIEAYFVGRWRVDRVIFDASGARIGAFTGSLTFAVDDGVLVYHEDGVLDFGSHRGPATRTLHYAVTGPGQADVHFGYGDFFHEVDLREGSWSTRHPCRDDLYQGEYRIIDADHWQQEWVVAGPTKNHTMSTDFRRETTV